MMTFKEITDDLNNGVELIRNGHGNDKCPVCAGRVLTCSRLGHRPEKDRHLLWHPDDLQKKKTEALK